MIQTARHETINAIVAPRRVLVATDTSRSSAGAERAGIEYPTPCIQRGLRCLAILVDPALTRGQPDERRPARDVVPIEQPAQLAFDRLDPQR